MHWGELPAESRQPLLKGLLYPFLPLLRWQESSRYYAQKHQQIHIRPDARGEAERVGSEAADGTKAAGQGDQTGPFTDDDGAVTQTP